MTIFIFRCIRLLGLPQGRFAPVWNCLALLPFLLPLTAVAFPKFGSNPQDRAKGEALYQDAYKAYQNGDYAGSQRLLEQADKLKPDQADGMNLLGVVLLKQRAYDRAEAAFARAVAIDPDLWAAQFNLAEVPYQRKDYAKARTRFDRLLAQTDRYKENRKWEMVLYKVFLSGLLTGDEAGARKKLAKLSAAPGTNPVLAYAEAAAAFHRKDAAGAQKAIATAQSKFPRETNDLFSEPLVQAGWLTLLPPTVPPTVPLPTNVAGTAGLLTGNGAPAALGAAARYGTPTTPGGALGGTRPVEIDPKLEAAVAEPLPEPGGAIKPVMSKVTSLPLPLPAANPKATPAPAPTKVAQTPVPDALPDPRLEHSGLLLD